PAPSGGFVNQGSYGNTAQASESPSAYVLVLSPSGGQSWPLARTFPIRWRSQDTQGQVQIDLLQQGSTSPVFTIAANAPNTGSYSWAIPASIPIANNSLARVTRLAPAATAGASASPFSIVPKVTVYYVNDSTANPGDWTTAAGSDTNDGLSPATP